MSVDSCQVLPKWKRLDTRVPITRPNSPQILSIDILTVNHAGIYYCETTNQEREAAKVGIKLDFDDHGRLHIKQLNERVLKQMLNDSLVQMDKHEGDLIDHIIDESIDYTRFRLPNIKISITDKLELAKSERVEINCESGKAILLSHYNN